MAEQPENQAVRGKPGRPRVHFDPCQQDEFLKLIRAGHGRTEARVKLGLSRRALTNTLRKFGEFRRAIRDAATADHQDLLRLARDLAKSGDGSMIQFLIARRDRARQMREARRERAEQMRQAHEDRIALARHKLMESEEVKGLILANIARTAAIFINRIPEDQMLEVMADFKRQLGEVSDKGR